jgi:hypothetical protein
VGSLLESGLLRVDVRELARRRCVGIRLADRNAPLGDALAFDVRLGGEEALPVVPSGALDYQCLVDVLDRKGLFSTKTYVECQCVSDGGFTICEANPNAKAPPSANLSYVDAQKAAFKKRAHWGQA